MDKTKYIIIAALSVLILLVIVYVTFLYIKTQPDTSAPVLPTPTVAISDINSSKIEIVTTLVPNDNNLSPSPPESLGGDVKIPEDLERSGSDREKLINASPVDTENFTISFDYSSLLFKVIFKYPTNSENPSRFEEWKELNYPDLGMYEFTFAN